MSNLPDQWVAELADRMLPDVRRSIRHAAESIEAHAGSPIEVKLAVAMFCSLRVGGMDAVVLRDGSDTEYFKQLCAEHTFVIALQYRWREYRSDICLGGRLVARLILIECDGHDFHERTKEQAAHDRRKDMLAQQDGYSILRFTGSQIHRDAYGCAYDTIIFSGERHRNQA